MILDYSSAYSYFFIANTSKTPQFQGTEVKNEKRVRKVEPTTGSSHLGQNIDTYA